MPPRKPGRGIVKTGNAGNSSKSSPLPAPPPANEPPKEKPLFPPGSKLPLSLLNERCQKNGWQKPEVIVRQQDQEFSFVVILRSQNKKTSLIDTVKLEPHPPYFSATALEARHWGATYALYRICNNIQLNRVLPPGPRDYWNQLEKEHKAAPQHQQWMYNPDPFTAKKEVEERQAAAEKKKEEVTTRPDTKPGSSAVGSEFAGAIEVKMGSSLREFVEEVIRKTHEARTPGHKDSERKIPEDSHSEISRSLMLLNFKPTQISRTLKALSTPSPLTSSLLTSCPTPLDAAISHLLLSLPECDLPPRFLIKGAGESFVQSAHKGSENLKTRWLIERAVKEAGYPEHIARKAANNISNDETPPTWAELLDSLNKMLLGLEAFDDEMMSDSEFDRKDRDFHRTSEIGALESVYPSVTANTAQEPVVVVYINIPVPDTPLVLHMVLPDSHPYPLSTRPPPMYVSSLDNTVAPYVRLHLLSTVLNASLDRGEGEGVGLIATGILEEEWANIQTNGPPDVADVLRPLIGSKVQEIFEDVPTSRPTRTKQRNGGGSPVDDRTDTQILADWEKTKGSQEYVSLLPVRQNLPAWKSKTEFLNALQKSRVVVCVGETGSGKTTQIPQYILDNYLDDFKSSSGRKSNILQNMQIIVTQPRRVAATSVAARVSSERGSDGSVAYTIRGESTANRRTKLLFCTTGVVLRRLTVGDGLKGVNIIIVDEVHERSVDSDFLLLELLELLKRNKELKVVLMSATINQETFLEYFKDASPSLVTIPGRTHPVKDIHLEHIIPHINFNPSPSKPVTKQTEAQLRAFRQIYESQGLDQSSVRAIETVVRSERIDYQLITAVVSYIAANKGEGAILIFLPGVQEITRCIDSLKSSSIASSANIFPLHANLSSNEQKAVFRNTPKRKIVVSTNVAETSITIDDVVYVIDTGKVKETSYDPETGLSALTETWVTKAAARQRRGRAGRVKPGECYKLYTVKQEQETMGDFPVPEILRVPLESLSLAVKSVREDEDVKLFLLKAIDPPPVAAMEKAWSVLEELGAVTPDGKLTALGRYLSLLPVDLRLGKMLILASIFDCLEPILTIAAILSSKPLFISPIDKRDEASKARSKFAFANSDLLTDMHAYDECINAPRLRSFCEENFISYTAVRDISSLREDFFSALRSAGFSQSLRSSSSSPHPALLQSIIMAGLYPRIARITLPSSAIKFDKFQGGTVQRAQNAKEYKLFDLDNVDNTGRGSRVFLHPSSVLFGQDKWKEHFVCYFRKAITSKPFLRDATEVPLFAVLLFGGPISVNYVGGGLTIGAPNGSKRIQMKAWPRIGVLANQLRQLLDEQLSQALETASFDVFKRGNSVLEAMMALLTRGEFGT
ncbi:hypothetical protein M422DRAFT_25225 [Sphaerobolus stellatus SS14]|nr:hypothetical protein M422DRAFT_25225 [Sphaerobolus stellatus SS14]